ncbi:hypothetical protein KKI17_01940 [Patescibacteria group bacterium]|nr:hypothetical protein [Patescibacteria group bacterium]
MKGFAPTPEQPSFPKNRAKRNGCLVWGFAALYLTVLILGAMIIIGMAIAFVVLGRQHVAHTEALAVEAYGAAEAGVEDALVRLQQDMAWSSPYSFSIGGASVTVTISAESGGARTITSTGSAQNRERTVEAVYELEGTEAQFFYGAQIGDWGIEMENISEIDGNVFSNGGLTGAGSSFITGTVQIAGPGDVLSGADVGGDAYVDSCQNSSIAGELHAMSESGCAYSSFVLEAPPAPVALPISAAQILQWQGDAQAGGTIGDVSISGGTTALGPKEIAGDLTLTNQGRLNVTGTIWVRGNITVQNMAQVRLDSSYGSLSGVILADGKITLENSSVSTGSGETGSYLMYLSTAALDPAIVIQNSADADILYASDGVVQIGNNSDMREVTGYGMRIKNNARVIYEIGLADTKFTSGPSAGWTVTSWKEVP